ncbi:hypothetical protein FNV43_RR02517 [Rhamnella rubrinervis]|uniref:Uncharacterized protein n=1 Tax=Rhamnella rubrinervis TaxID=2594499 RepID=A0A8K0HRS2_9ROSA|nr:hypothetical protein FNV43_RR02517 [Rhamnella rubrinervis]
MDIDKELRFAEEIGDLDGFYKLALVKHNALQWDDNIVYTSTPCHVAARHGHLVALEMLRLRPEFGSTLDSNGLTPIQVRSPLTVEKILSVACSNSIMDVTIRNETALHLAAKHRVFNNFNMLLSHLTNYGDKLKQARDLINSKDIDGNITVLHIAERENQT